MRPRAIKKRARVRRSHYLDEAITNLTDAATNPRALINMGEAAARVTTSRIHRGARQERQPRRPR
jgi:hypothetical protein